MFVYVFNMLNSLNSKMSIMLFVLYPSTCAERAFHLPTFNAEINVADNTSFLMFKCTIFRQPFGSLHFLVNGKTVDVMHFENNKCYNISRECTNETCYCSYTDYSFVWYYSVNESSMYNTYMSYGVVMKIQIGKNSEVIKISMSGIYEKSGFKLHETLYQNIMPAAEKNEKMITVPNQKCEHLQLPRMVMMTISIFTGSLFFGVVCILIALTRRIMRKNANNQKEITPFMEIKRASLRLHHR